MTIPVDATVSVSKDQVSTTTGTDVVILELTDGVYYGLDEVGQTVWEIISKPTQVSEIVDQVIDRYDVEREKCSEDIQGLLSSLLDRKLIQIQDAGTV